VWLSGLLTVWREQPQPVLQRCKPGRGKPTCSVKHPQSEKDAEKLEKMQKSSIYILSPEHKPWSGFKGGENMLQVVFNPTGEAA